MPERRVSKIVGQANRLGERFIDAERARHGAPDLGDFERMSDASAIQVAFVIHEYLGLVDQSTKRVRMDDAISIALELGPKARWRLGVSTASTLLVDRGIRREHQVHWLPAAHAQRLA